MRSGRLRLRSGLHPMFPRFGSAYQLHDIGLLPNLEDGFLNLDLF